MPQRPTAESFPRTMLKEIWNGKIYSRRRQFRDDLNEYFIALAMNFLQRSVDGRFSIIECENKINKMPFPRHKRAGFPVCHCFFFFFFVLFLFKSSLLFFPVRAEPFPKMSSLLLTSIFVSMRRCLKRERVLRKNVLMTIPFTFIILRNSMRTQ